MPPDISPLSAQTSLFAGLGFLTVFITWIRHRQELALVPVCLGLLAVCASGLADWLGYPGVLAPLLLTAGFLLFYWGTCLARPGHLLRSLLLLVLVSHFLILLITEPGYEPREASSFLVWAGLAMVTTSNLVTREEAPLKSKRTPLLLLFGMHALFCLFVTSGYQLGLLGSGGEEFSLFPFVRQTELTLFSVLLVISVMWVRFQEQHEPQGHVRESQRVQPSAASLLPVCSCCRKVREQDDSWSRMESYFHKHLSLNFTHGICPECAESLYPGVNTKAVVPRTVLRRVSNHPFPASSLESVQNSRELARAE